MRKLTMVYSGLLIALILNGCSNNTVTYHSAQSVEKIQQTHVAKHRHESNFDIVPYPTLDSLIADSQLIAEVKVSNRDKSINYNGVDFTISTVTVKDVVFGDETLKNKEIKILETGIDTNVVSKNERYLIFSTKSNGAVMPDAYVPLGVYQGKFHIETNDVLEYEGKKFTEKESFQDQFDKKSLQDVKEIIKSSIE